MTICRAIFFILCIFHIAGCQAPLPPDRLDLQPASFAALPGWQEDDHGSALGAFMASCGRLSSFKGMPEFGDISDWRAICDAGRGIKGRKDAADFFEKWFVPYLATNNGAAEGLFTGYYEPQLQGSRKSSARYHAPLYRRPSDLVDVDLGAFREEWRGQTIVGQITGNKLVPFSNRSAINKGALSGKGLELLFVDSPVDSFFLQVQGSGRVVLDDGKTIRVSYDGKNGHAYVPIGRELAERGILKKEDVSLQTIRAWMQAHPEEAVSLMEKNPSYVFFRELPIEDPALGPPGAQGVTLTPGRSLAVDRAFLPLGTPLWLVTQTPLEEAPFQRLMVAQDTGGAIKGPVRGDIFFGFGEKAELQAGHMKARGRYYLLLPKSIARRGS